MLPPSGEYLTALSSRFMRIWRTLSASASTGGTSGSLSTVERQVLRQVRVGRRDDRRRELGRVAALDGDVQRPRLEPAHPEDVVDDPRQPLRLVGHDVEQALALRFQRGLLPPERERRAVDRGQRRSELVRDRRDELASSGARRGAPRSGRGTRRRCRPGAPRRRSTASARPARARAERSRRAECPGPAATGMCASTAAQPGNRLARPRDRRCRAPAGR